MVHLDSSAISHADYDEASEQLRVTFTTGGAYTYYGVPKWKYVGLVNAASAGTYFHQNIRDQHSVSGG